MINIWQKLRSSLNFKVLNKMTFNAHDKFQELLSVLLF